MAPKNQPQPAAGGQTSAQILDALNSGDLSGLISAGVVKTLGPTQTAITQAQQQGALPADFKPFMEDDEWSPMSFAPDDQARIKALMKASGLYGRGGYVGKGWSTDDATAMKTVLAYANSVGIDDPLAAAKQFAQEAATGGLTAKATENQLVTRFANPEAVRQVVRRASLDLMGQRLSDAEEARLVAGFQGQYQGAQRAQFAAQESEAGGAYTEPLSAEEYATAQIENRPEAGAHRYLDAFDAIVNSLGSTVPGPTLTGQGGVR